MTWKKKSNGGNDCATAQTIRIPNPFDLFYFYWYWNIDSFHKFNISFYFFLLKQLLSYKICAYDYLVHFFSENESPSTKALQRIDNIKKEEHDVLYL